MSVPASATGAERLTGRSLRRSGLVLVWLCAVLRWRTSSGRQVVTIHGRAASWRAGGRISLWRRRSAVIGVVVHGLGVSSAVCGSTGRCAVVIHCSRRRSTVRTLILRGIFSACWRRRRAALVAVVGVPRGRRRQVLVHGRGLATWGRSRALVVIVARVCWATARGPQLRDGRPATIISVVPAAVVSSAAVEALNTQT